MAPWTGGLFAAGLLALVGLPFGLFISEFALFRAGFAQHHPWLMGAALLLLLVAFVSFITRLNRMLYGEAPPRSPWARRRVGVWRRCCSGAGAGRAGTDAACAA